MGIWSKHPKSTLRNPRTKRTAGLDFCGCVCGVKQFQNATGRGGPFLYHPPSQNPGNPSQRRPPKRQKTYQIPSFDGFWLPTLDDL